MEHIKRCSAKCAPSLVSLRLDDNNYRCSRNTIFLTGKNCFRPPPNTDPNLFHDEAIVFSGPWCSLHRRFSLGSVGSKLLEPLKTKPKIGIVPHICCFLYLL